MRIGILLAVFAAGAGAHATTAPPAAIVSSSSIRVYLNDIGHGPELRRIEGASKGEARFNRAGDNLPATVEVDGTQTPVKWVRNKALGHLDARHAVFVYESAKPHLRLGWEWEARGSAGPVEHRVTVENLGHDEVWLPLMDSLRLDLSVPTRKALRTLYVEKGADRPSPVGTHIDAVSDGYRWTGYSSTYAVPQKGEAWEIIPAVMVWDGKGGGWYAGIEFSGRTRVSLERSGRRLQAVLGLNPEPGPFRTRLAPGESFVTPTVFLGDFRGGPDDAGNQLRPWVRAVLGNPLTWRDPQYPLLVNNSWGSGMQVDEALALRMISDSKELGLEMFHLDAGWFRAVVDWEPDPKKFPHGLGMIADAAHKAGLRFGIWTDWTQAGLSTEPGALNMHDPKMKDWVAADVKPDWKPEEEFKGQTIDIGVPEAERWADATLKHIVNDYKLDMLEHDGYLVAKGCVHSDHPHAPPVPSTLKTVHDSGFDFVVASNSTDVSYHAVRAYYRIYERLRREHPGLLFEICNDGGRMVDFGSAAHGDYFSITDAYDPLSNRRAFYDTSHLLPASMLESYVEKWPTPKIENFRYMLHSGMMGWLSVMLDTTQWTEEQHRAAKQEFALYKEKLRPLIRDAELYHVSARPDGAHWDGIEYWDRARWRGVVYAFRGSATDEPSHRFVLAGLRADGRYRLHFEDGSAPDRVASGRELMGVGLDVRLPVPLSSELVLFEEERGSARDGIRGPNTEDLGYPAS